MTFSDITAPAKDFKVKTNKIKMVRVNINWSLDNSVLLLKNSQCIGNSFSVEKTSVKNGPIIPIPTNLIQMLKQKENQFWKFSFVFSEAST